MRVIIIIFILPLVTRGQPAMEPFVVHGRTAKIKDYPYVAFLGIEQHGELSWSCGSSILNQYITLTAAHCLAECTKKSSIIISVGHESSLRGAMSSGYSFVIHPSYSHETSVNDIGLVRVKTPIAFNVNVSRVAVMQHPPHNEEAVIAGWGYVDERKFKSTEVLKASLQSVWSNEDCVNSMKNMPVGTFCASDQSGTSYPSIGDSGSPLVIHKYIQIGLVSYKKPDISRKLVVYTDTGYFYKWIKRNSKRIMCT